MKRFRRRIGSILLVFGLVIALNLQAEDGWHELEDVRGRSVKAQIVSYDSSDKTVEIQRADDQIFRVSLSGFSEETQNEIRLWGYGYEFYESLQISAVPKRLDIPEVNYGWRYDDFELENIGYLINVENPTETVFETVEINYCVYYTQTERVFTGGCLIEDFVQCGQFKVDSMEPGSNHDLTTDTVLLYRDPDAAPASVKETSMFGTEQQLSGKTRGYIIGLRIRVSTTTPSGEKLLREYCTPGELPETTEWTTSPTYNALNRILLQEKIRLQRQGDAPNSPSS